MLQIAYMQIWITERVSTGLGRGSESAHPHHRRLIKKMESRLRIAGQAVQPVLMMFPLGLFTMAALFDAGNLMGGPDILGALGFWNIVAGLIGGVLVALAGAIDLMLVRGDTRARRVGVLLGLMHMGVLILFAVIVMLRIQNPDRAVGGGLLVVELLALGAGLFGAYYGGELINPRKAPAYQRVG